MKERVPIKICQREIRCKKCGRLLMKGEVKAIEIKCPKCGYIQTIVSSEEIKSINRERDG